MSILAPSPGTMLGYAALDSHRAYKVAVRRHRWRHLRRLTAPATSGIARWVATIAILFLGSFTFTTGTAQAGWTDIADLPNTIMNMCGPNDVPEQYTYQGLDTLLGLNGGADPANAHVGIQDGMRKTVRPDWSSYSFEGTVEDDPNLATTRLTAIYSGADAGPDAAWIAHPQYQRYGFSALQWNQYGYSCFSPALVMGPLANLALTGFVHIPMILSMTVLNLAMGDGLYKGFAVMMEPFIGAMYDLMNPWIFLFVPIGVLITWLTSRGSLQATMKAAGWGVMILSVFLLMGSSTSRLITYSTNVVTEVAGTAACKLSAANNASSEGTTYEPPVGQEACLAQDANANINQALWEGISYRTWLLGQVGPEQASMDLAASQEGRVGIGPALLNGQYLGVDENGNLDEVAKTALKQKDRWNYATYVPDDSDLNTKVHVWGTNNAWHEVPYLAVIKVICNDQDTTDTDSKGSESKGQRWMYAPARGQTADTGESNYCDATGGGATLAMPAITGETYNTQIVNALTGSVCAIAVGLTVAAAGLYLAVQKMLFFFLLFLAPLILAVSSFGDRKRRPFAVRYAELIGANLLKQIAAVCICLFVSYSMQSLFLSDTFSDIPWLAKPFMAVVYFAALLFLAFPLMGILKGAIKGDVSSVDKAAHFPHEATKGAAKVAGVGALALATGGAGLALGSAGSAAALGKAGTVLGKAGMVAGRGKAGTLLRRGGHLASAGQSILGAKANSQGKKGALNDAASHLLSNSKTNAKYMDPATGKLRPDAQALAVKDAKKMANEGVLSQQKEKAYEQQLANFSAKFREGTGVDIMADRKAQKAALEGARKKDAEEDLKAAGRHRAGMPAAPGGTGPEAGPRTQGESKDGDLSTVANDAHTQGQTTSGESQDGTGGQKQGVPFGAPGTGRDGGTPSLAESYEHYAKQARGNLDMPVHARNMAYTQAGRVEGDEVLDAAQMSLSDAVAHPEALLSGDAYSGGNTTKMDPFHAATGPMMQLRFASASGDADAIEKAMNDASAAIADHGVPAQMSGMHAIGDQAAAFNPVALMGAMPNIGTDTSMIERADAAQTMMAAAVSMPADYGARNEVMAYTEALATPTVDPGTLDVLRDQAIGAMQTAHGGEQPLVAPEAPAAAPQPAPSGGGQEAYAAQPVAATATAEAPAAAPAPTAPAASEAPAAQPASAPAAPAVDTAPVAAAASAAAATGAAEAVSAAIAAERPDTSSTLSATEIADAVTTGVERGTQAATADAPTPGPGPTPEAPLAGSPAPAQSSEPRRRDGGDGWFGWGGGSDPSPEDEGPMQRGPEEDGVFSFPSPGRRRKGAPRTSSFFGASDDEGHPDDSPEEG